MKKTKLLLLALTLPLLAGCNSSEIYRPIHPYPGTVDVIDGEAKEDEYTEFNMTVYFYLDYSHSDNPVYEMPWYMLKPLGECPAEADLSKSTVIDTLKEKKIVHDELYPTFIGYSEYSSSIDEDHIWKFETDYKQSNILRLYGIWVKE